MPAVPNDVQAVFLDRIERRVKILKTLLDAGLGVYQAAEEQQRKRAIDQVVRLTARTSELPQLTPETLAKASDIVAAHLEPMQKVLPHDVQYRNRLRKSW
ncbi:MAG: hypothetical protein AzoDbin1_01754 [Azoarcus sp.]|uniref:Uncharacterized protein n=1 Tax=Aromatoleum tolulyticum TaxID=34027 RepID=A0A1N6Z083_9RHOO|nr:hypothetical protein [Aromatoleum tolulyticum]MCK9985282.1 hypothetical protein [Azoarcus sp.]SIR20131.1 hypothetical protein SAMN05421829_11133 [Aromatoleum tolulyticum]